MAKYRSAKKSPKIVKIKVKVFKYEKQLARQEKNREE